MDYNKYEFKEAVDDSQIAYLDCVETGYDALYTGKKDQVPPTLEEIILASMGEEDFKQALNRAQLVAVETGKPADQLSIVDIVKFSNTISREDKRRIQELNPKSFGYRIKDVYNTNDMNGFYSCCIEKDDGEICLAFRGSENCKLKNNFVNDWCRADLGLMQNEETIQQKEIFYMLRYYKDIGILDDAKTITTAGHSLGGNLATHCAVLLASKDYEEYLPKLKNAYNLDGPGFSKKYLEKHKSLIKKLALDEDGKPNGIVKHAKWSLVGDLLNDLSYTEDGQEIDVEDAAFLKINEDKLTNFVDYRHRGKCSLIHLVELVKRQLCRHTTEAVTPPFDENNRMDTISWKLEEGPQDPLSKMFGNFSRGVDKFVPEIVTRTVGGVCTWIVEKVFIRPQEKEDTTPSITGVDVVPEGETNINDIGTYHKIPTDFYNKNKGTTDDGNSVDNPDEPEI